jgi:hypothetical protein
MRLRGDAGQVAGIEAVPFGLLVFASGALVVAQAWAVVDAKFLAGTAAREATRAYVEAPSAEAADREALAAGRAAVPRRGDTDVDLRRVDAGYGRCREVTFEATWIVPAVVLPWRGPRAEVAVRARHTEVVDPYRDGLAGAASCAP